MYDIYTRYPIVCIISLIISLIVTVLLSANLYIFFNKHLLAANNKNKKRRWQKIFNFVNRKAESLKENTNLAFYNRCKLKLTQSGFYLKNATLIYLIIEYFVPPILFILMLFSNGLSSAILFTICFIAGIQFIIWAQRKEIEMEWKKIGYVVYRYIYNQLSSGVSIHVILSNLYLVGIGTKLEKPLYDLSARYGHTMDIDYSLKEFKKYFKLVDVEMFANTLEQGVKLGNIETLVSRQVRSMFKQYMNYVQNKTDRCKKYTNAIVLILGTIVCTMILIPMFNDIARSVEAIFSY